MHTKLRALHAAWVRMKNNSNIQQELDKIYLGQLPTIFLVICLYYSFITVTHFFFLPTKILLPIAGTSALTAITALTLRALIKRGKIRASKSHIAFAPVALLVLTTVYAHIYLSQEQHQLTNAILALFAFGLVTLSPVYFAFYSTVSVTLYIVMLVALPGPYTIHFAFMLVAALVLSILGFLLRYRGLYRSTRLLASNREKTRSLAKSTHEIQTKMAEVQAANAARDVFLANITHELRTPLTGVLGMLDLVEDTELNKEQAFMVRTAQTSAGYLLNIVNDLLDLAKLQADKLELKLSSVDVADLTRNVVVSFKAAAQKKNLTLAVDIADSFPPYRIADGARLSQILLNLVNNAIKFTDHGEVKVSLTQAPGDICLWTVSDTGCGIAQDQRAKLFKRFEQIDASATRSTSGTGLGLAIVQELIQLYGGEITVESEFGKGTIFTVSLQLAATDALPHMPEPNKEPRKNITERIDALSLAHLNLRALAAEDNSINKMLLQRVSARLGIDLMIVENGQLAVDAVQQAKIPFDLIFMDAQMPVMDGITATRLINETVPNAPPIIAITANTLDADIKNYLQAGMAGFVGKPINLEHFHETILRILSKHT